MTTEYVTVGDLEYNYLQYLLQVEAAAMKLSLADPHDVVQYQREYDALIALIAQVKASKLTLYDKRDHKSGVAT